MVLQIKNSSDTWVDITPYIAFGGVKWERYDIEDPDSGRTLDGLMHRGRVATKRRLDITCRPLRFAELNIVLNLIQPETISVKYTDPLAGTTVTKTMYSNNNPASYCIKKGSVEWWSSISFPLIEV